MFWRKATAAPTKEAPPIDQFDLAFVVDTTGSMQPLISAAQRSLIDMINALSRAASVDMRLGVVEYRDHPPQDTLVCRAYGFTSELAAAKQTLRRLRADGGGDTPEAVFAGLVATRRQLEWRRHARRIAVLVGDAPPHGVGCRGDAFREGCPSGETIHSTAACLEDGNIRLYAIALSNYARPSFGDLATLTGGRLFAAEQADAGIRHLEQLMKDEFGQLEFDRQVHCAWTDDRACGIEEIAGKLGASPARAAASVSRLKARGLLTE